jgi:hypothetical protein
MTRIKCSKKWCRTYKHNKLLLQIIIKRIEVRKKCKEIQLKIQLLGFSAKFTETLVSNSLFSFIFLRMPQNVLVCAAEWKF